MATAIGAASCVGWLLPFSYSCVGDVDDATRLDITKGAFFLGLPLPRTGLNVTTEALISRPVAGPVALGSAPGDPTPPPLSGPAAAAAMPAMAPMPMLMTRSGRL